MRIHGHEAVTVCRLALSAGAVLHFTDGETTFTAGRDVPAVGNPGWAIHSYCKGAVDTDTAFWGEAHLARTLVYTFDTAVAHAAAVKALEKMNLDP